MTGAARCRPLRQGIGLAKRAALLFGLGGLPPHAMLGLDVRGVRTTPPTGTLGSSPLTSGIGQPSLVTLGLAAKPWRYARCECKRNDKRNPFLLRASKQTYQQSCEPVSGSTLRQPDADMVVVRDVEDQLALPFLALGAANAMKARSSIMETA